MFRVFQKILAIPIVFACSHLYGQDVSFSQLFFNHLYLNPAYAGASKYIRLGVVYRNQWMLANNPYSTYGVSYDRTIQSIRSGVGINIINDVQANGALNRATIDLIYAYGVQLTYNSHIRWGIQATNIVRSQNFTSLVFPDMIGVDGEQTSANPDAVGHTYWNYDFSVGAVGDWDMFFGGVAVHHLLQPAEGSSFVPRKYTVHAGFEVNLLKWYRFKEQLLFSPNVIYIHQLNYKQLNLGFYFTRFNIVAGLWVRNNISLNSNTFVFTAGYSNDQFRFGYSYDFGVFANGFRGVQTSTHEVTFGWNFEYKKGKRKFRYIKCPKF